MSVEDARAFVRRLYDDEDLAHNASKAYAEVLVQIAEEQGFTMSTEDLAEVFRSERKEELSDESLEDVAGGAPPPVYPAPPVTFLDEPYPAEGVADDRNPDILG